MPGSGDHRDPHRIPDRDHIAVADRDPAESHVVGPVHVIPGTGLAGQRQAAGHVVIVNVGLEHMGDLGPPAGRCRQHPVNVPLRIHHQRGSPVGRQVTAVPQRRGVDTDDLDHNRTSPARTSAAHATTISLYTPKGISEESISGEGDEGQIP